MGADGTGLAEWTDSVREHPGEFLNRPWGRLEHASRREVSPEPIDCAQCGTAIPSTQTKSLDSTLDTYRVGDVVSAEGITTGVLAEELYCEPCRKFDQNSLSSLAA